MELDFGSAVGKLAGDLSSAARIHDGGIVILANSTLTVPSTRRWETMLSAS
jgi:hypothetical protein